ncbi:hypothetical protein BKA93DRAFT_15173 [Sparassis latifolia]
MKEYRAYCPYPPPLLPSTGHTAYGEPSHGSTHLPGEAHRRAESEHGHSHHSHRSYSRPVGYQHGSRVPAGSYSVPAYNYPLNYDQGNNHHSQYNTATPTYYSRGNPHSSGRHHYASSTVPQVINLSDPSRQHGSGHHYVDTHPAVGTDHLIFPPHHHRSGNHTSGQHYHNRSPYVVNLNEPLRARHPGPTVGERVRRFFGFPPEHYANYVDVRTGHLVDWRGRPIFQV